MAGAIAGLIGSLKAAVISITNRYFFYNYNGLPQVIRTIHTESNGNFYTGGGEWNYGPKSAYIVAYQQDETVLWANRYFWGTTAPLTGTDLNPLSMTSDANYLYVLCGSPSVSIVNIYILKIDKTSGTLVLSKNLNNSSDSYSKGIKVLPNGNIAVASWYNSKGAVNRLGVYDTSLTNLWTKLQGSGQSGTLLTDSSSNIYYDSGYDNMLQKISSTGTLIWSLDITGAYSKMIALDSAGNIWAATTITSATGINFVFRKFNSSAVYQTSYAFNIPGYSNSCYVIGFVMDSADNMYVCLYAYSPTRPLLLKFSSSGTLIWARALYWTFSGGTTSTSAFELSINSSGDLFIGGFYSTGGGTYGASAKIRSDGTITGTFSQGPSFTVTYASITVNTTTAAYTQGSSIGYFSNTNSYTATTNQSFGTLTYSPNPSGYYN
jgi:hypothetical protein